MRNTGVNCFWIIDNAADVLKNLKKVNRTKGATHFDSFDFSTLYTNIPHDLLLDSISKLISEAYRIRGAKYIVVQSDGKTYWSNTMSARNLSITEDQLVKQISRGQYLHSSW